MNYVTKIELSSGLYYLINYLHVILIEDASDRIQSEIWHNDILEAYLDEASLYLKDLINREKSFKLNLVLPNTVLEEVILDFSFTLQICSIVALEYIWVCVLEWECCEYVHSILFKATYE